MHSSCQLHRERDDDTVLQSDYDERMITHEGIHGGVKQGERDKVKKDSATLD